MINFTKIVSFDDILSFSDCRAGVEVVLAVSEMKMAAGPEESQGYGECGAWREWRQWCDWVL